MRYWLLKSLSIVTICVLSTLYLVNTSSSYLNSSGPSSWTLSSKRSQINHERRRLNCVWSNWQHKTVCSENKPPAKKTPIVGTNVPAVPKIKHPQSDATIEQPEIVQSKTKEHSQHPQQHPSSSSSQSVLPPKISATIDHKRERTVEHKRSTPFVSPLLTVNEINVSKNTSLHILRRTVLLMGPLHVEERKQRARLLKHYSPFFANIVFVFLAKSPQDHIEGAMCGVDFIECDVWPSREHCWLNMLRDISTGNLPFAPNLMKLMHQHPNGTQSNGPHFTNFDGFLYAHADLWINPYAIVPNHWETNSQHSLWFPKHRCQGKFAQSTMSVKAHAAIEDSLNKISKTHLGSKYSFATENRTKQGSFGCRGWADIVYLPAVAFSEFEFLLKIIIADGTFHEVAIPTIECLLAPSYGERHLVCFGQPGFGDPALALPDEHVFGDHNGEGTKRDLLKFPCGHRWALENKELANTFVNDVLKVPVENRFPLCPV